MALPPFPRPLGNDPHGKPAVNEWLVERVREEQASARADAETDRRIGRLLDRGRKAVNEPEGPGLEGVTASGDPPEGRDDSGARV